MVLESYARTRGRQSMESLAQRELPPTAERWCDTYHPVFAMGAGVGTTGAGELITVDLQANQTVDRLSEW